MSEMPLVFIVILNWNNATDTLACLDAVAKLSYPRNAVLVVDNCSSDNSVELIRSRHPDVEILMLSQNLGYTGGNNRGIEKALHQGADYIWLLNDDTLVAPDSLQKLIDAAISEPSAGILGPKVYTYEARQTLLSAGGFFTAGYRVQQRGVGQPDQGQYDQLAEVDFVSGCAMLVRRALIEQTGMLDETFFAYEEDVEWCYRATQGGFKVLYVPQAHVWHPDTRMRDELSRRVVYYMARNRLLSIRKHRLGVSVFWVTLLQELRTLAAWTLRGRWRHKREQRNALALALIDYFRGKTGRCERV